MKARRWSLEAVVSLALLGVTTNVLATAPSPTVRYMSANGDDFRVEQQSKSDGRTMTYAGGGDSMLGSDDTCTSGPDFVCIDLAGGGHPLRLMVPRDLRRRISATVYAMKTTQNRQAMEQLRWSDGDFDYRVEPRGRIPNNIPVVWEPVRFFGTETDAILVWVYKSGQVDLMHPVATFFYNPEHGVLALDYPHGSEHGGTDFVSYWLEGTCGLIPIRPCLEKPTK